MTFLVPLASHDQTCLHLMVSVWWVEQQLATDVMAKASRLRGLEVLPPPSLEQTQLKA